VLVTTAAPKEQGSERAAGVRLKRPDEANSANSSITRWDSPLGLPRMSGERYARKRASACRPEAVLTIVENCFGGGDLSSLARLCFRRLYAEEPSTRFVDLLNEALTAQETLIAAICIPGE
jgi:hypothetical protein